MNKRKVLIVSGHKDTFTIIKNVLPSIKYSCLYLPTILDAKKQLHKERYDILIIQTPIKDEFGVISSIDFVRSFNVSVLLLVKNDIFDQVNYKVNEYGIYVLGLPTNKNVIYQSILQLEHSILMKEKYEKEILKIKKKLHDEKKISQAKLMLIEQYHWSEQKAHHYIEKIAMDSSKTRVEVAIALLNKMEQEN